MFGGTPSMMTHTCIHKIQYTVQLRKLLHVHRTKTLLLYARSIGAMDNHVIKVWGRAEGSQNIKNDNKENTQVTNLKEMKICPSTEGGPQSSSLHIRHKYYNNFGRLGFWKKNLKWLITLIIKYILVTGIYFACG